MNNVTNKKFGILKTVIASFSLLKEAGGGKYISILVFGLINSISISVLALINKYFISSVEESTRGINSSSVYNVWFWICVFFIIEIISTIADRSSKQGMNSMKLKCKYYVLEKLMDKSSHIKTKYFDDFNMYNKFKLTVDNLADRISDVISCSVNFVFSIVNFTSLFLVISSIDFKIIFVLIIGVIPSILITKSSFVKEYYQALWNLSDFRKANYMNNVLVDRNYQKDIRFGNYHNYLLNKYEELTIKVHNKNMKILKKYMFLRILGSVFSYISVAVAMFYVIVLISRGSANMGAFVLVYSSMFAIQNAFSSIFNSISMINKNGLYIDNYTSVMEYEDEEEKKPFKSMWNDNMGNEIEKKESIERLKKGDIRVDNVSFTYPNAENRVLSGINCYIKDGEKIAIIGENGCGKTTFVSLLLGLYEPDEGNIYYEDTPISQQIKKVRESISCVLQGFGQYQMTISNNVAIGDANRNISSDEINEVCSRFYLDDFANKLIYGLDTYVGNIEESGVFLSGGEWQKVALARALIRKDARILILDEPTAALDPISESKLYEEFEKLSGDKTTLFISHRLAVTKIVDRILVFDKGSIVEDGNHEQLMREKGKYYHMYMAQAQWYTKQAEIKS